MSKLRALYLRSQLAAVLAVTGLSAGCAQISDGSEAEVEGTSAALTGTIHLAGHVGSGRIGIAGVTVALSGGSQATAITDADGNYKFDVVPGSYTLNYSKAGASFSPSLENVNGATASSFHPVTCSGSCLATGIFGDRELIMSHPGTIQDARANSATNGPWSFRFLMGQMAPAGMTDSQFTKAWLQQIAQSGPINGFADDARNIGALNWPTATDGSNGAIDWTTTPFRLLAIVNRTDLHATGAGEGRFVFGIPNSAITVIFEFGLPTSLTRKAWVQKFHQLNTLTPGSAAFNTTLQGITDLFVKANTSPGRPNGSSINQVRLNEIALSTAASPLWQLREFHLQNGGTLQQAGTAQTPADIAMTPGGATNVDLASFLNNNAVDFQSTFAVIPNSFIGAQSSEDPTPKTWQFASFSNVSEPVRHAFAGQTCNGCHQNEVNTNLPAGATNPQNLNLFYHISPLAPTNADGQGHLSAFLKEVEIPRRAIFVQNLLNCSGSTCATGAEPALP